MCDHLEAVFRNQIRRLVINLPPRIGKSSVVSVVFPAWCWTNRPEYKSLYSSYAGSLATRDSVSTRSIIQSPWYQRHYGHLFRLTEDTNLKMRFKNDRGGERIASSVNGAILGEGGDLLVADDPNNTKEIESDAIRNETNRWWDEVMSSRLNDPKNGARIIVSQRTHEDDLSGHALATGGYEHLCMPMEYEPSILVNGYELPPTSIGWADPRTEPGELLWPERIGEEEIEQFKLDMGSFAYSGQHQQRPVAREGGLFKILWWGDYNLSDFAVPGVPGALKLPEGAEVIQVWDTAYKEHTRADWSVCQTWARIGNFAYVLDVYREKVDFPKLKRDAKRLYEQYQPGVVLIENKASGISLCQELLVDTDMPVILVQPSDGDKVTRATAATPYVESGRVLLPREETAWKEAWLYEHTRFPRTIHDDQCFVAGTMVQTARGEVPIEGVRVGEWVATRGGYNRVTAAGLTRRGAPLQRMSLSNGRHLTGTPNHPVWVEGKGFVRIDTTVMGDILLSWKHQRRSSTTESSSDATPTLAMSRTHGTIVPARVTPSEAFKPCTKKYGRIGGVLSPLITTFIIKMRTRLTTTLTIWSVLPSRNIVKNIEIGGELPSSLHIWPGYGKVPVHGTVLPRDWRGIARTALSPRGKDPRVKRLAEGAGFPSRPTTGPGQGTAPTSAGRGTVPVFLRKHVASAARCLGRFPARRPVPVYVVTRYAPPELGDVYNLTVEGAHEYFANEVLVHNCDTTVMAVERLFPRDASGLLPIYDRDHQSRFSIDRGASVSHTTEDIRVTEADLTYAAMAGGRKGREPFGLAGGEDLSAFRQVFGRSM